jgi:hypothetical protein
MATTTNYSWTTPDDTALVKDGAAAIRTLGSSVDTTVKNLNPETTLGDIAYRSSTANVKTRLALGTAGQVLAVNSGATAPEWVTASSGGMTLISETVASAITSLSLSSIPQTYKQLVLIFSGITHSGSGTDFDLRLNNNSSAVYVNKFMTLLDGSSNNAATASGTSLVSNNTSYSLFGSSNNSAGLQRGNTGVLTIDNYASTTKLKTIYGNWAGGSSTSFYQVPQYLGLFNSTSAITSLDIFRVSGTATFSNSTDTSIRLYGVS